MSGYDVLFDDQKAIAGAEPSYFDPSESRVPLSSTQRRGVWPSKMFTIKLELQDFIRVNPDVPVYDASQGDGGASLGGIPPQELAEALTRYLPAECSTKYGDPIGRADVRTAIFENYYGFEPSSGITPDQIIVGDGGRDLLQKWYQVVLAETNAVGGNIIVSAAPWGSYTQGPYLNSLNILCAPGSADNAFKLSPDAIDTCLEHSRRDDRPVVGLIITSPDNPTGNYTQPSDLVALIEHATARGIPHIFVDVVYQAVTDPDVGLYDVNGIFSQLSADARGRLCFMDSLTKAAGASNLRNAHVVVGTPDYAQRFKGVATHTVLPNAIGEAAALEIYSRSEPLQHPWIRQVVDPTAQSRRIVQQMFADLGYRFIADQGYYAFVNVWPWLGKKLPDGMTLQGADGNYDTILDVTSLKSYLTTRCGLAVIHGTVFRQPHFIRFSYANAPEYTRAAIQRLHDSLLALR